MVTLRILLPAVALLPLLWASTGAQKGWSTRNQRKIYKTLKNTGLKWFF